MNSNMTPLRIWTRTGILSVVAAVVMLLASERISRATPDSGDHLWNLRENGDDRFHSNEAWLRPWRSGSDDGWGRWVGNYSYELQWGSTSTIGNADGSFSLSRGRDNQFHAWTYAYVQTPKTVSLSGSGDCVPKCFLNYAFDSPLGFTASLGLTSGWNRIDITGYNQNDSYTFSSGALAGSVDILNHDPFDLTPEADFLWSPSQGWSGVTEFSFTDSSSNNPDTWRWDVDNSGTVDYTGQNVLGHKYSASDGSLPSPSHTFQLIIFSDLI